MGLIFIYIDLPHMLGKIRRYRHTDTQEGHGEQYALSGYHAIPMDIKINVVTNFLS